MEGIGGEEIVFLLQQRLIDDKTRAFLQQITALRSRIAELKRRIEEIQREQKAVFEDQSRLRGNLQSLGQSEEERMLRSRIVKQLNHQEDRLEAIRKTLGEIQTEIRAKEEELGRLVLNYSFETR
jgi:chromosome segregation ATPase